MKEEYNKTELLEMLETIYDDLEELDNLLLDARAKQKKELEAHLDHLTHLEAAFSALEEKLKKDTSSLVKNSEKIRRTAILKLELG